MAPVSRRFADRADAGRQLAEGLAARSWVRPAVVGLPRGGVVVAAPVATALGCLLTTYVAAKLGAPGREEYALGAVGEDGDAVWSAAADDLLPDPRDRDRLLGRQLAEVRRRVAVYRDGRPLPNLTDRDVLCVDDGVATGMTTRAALLGLRRHAPRRLLLAVPVAAPQAVRDLDALADEVVCLLAPDSFTAVGTWYRDFTQVTDDEVLAALR